MSNSKFQISSRPSIFSAIDDLSEIFRKYDYECFEVNIGDCTFRKDKKVFNVSSNSIWIGWEDFLIRKKGLCFHGFKRNRLIKAIEIFEWE